MIGARIDLRFSMKIVLHCNRIVWFYNFVDFFKIKYRAGITVLTVYTSMN